MLERFPVVRRLPRAALLLAVTALVGCGGGLREADQSAPPAQGHPQPGGDAAPPPPPPGQPGYDYAQPMPSPRPSPMPGPAQVGTTKEARNLTTLEGAQAAFAADEQRLSLMLKNEADELSKQGACGRICDALASMRRSAEAICELAGEDDARCSDARGKLATNEQRIAEAGCACE